MWLAPMCFSHGFHPIHFFVLDAHSSCDSSQCKRVTRSRSSSRLMAERPVERATGETHWCEIVELPFYDKDKRISRGLDQTIQTSIPVLAPIRSVFMP